MKLVILMLLFSVSSHAQQEVERFFNDKTKIENPLDLRDPFRAPVFKTVREKTADKVTLDPEEVLQTVHVSDIRVQGVLIGKERRAIVRITTNDKIAPVIIKEGYRIGPDRVEVKAILPGGVILVEKMVNVYGQEEYLETVIPISK
ncbi:MAG: hypothetical protein WDA09_00625 [Bacteriovoracaceae bacterium]